MEEKENNFSKNNKNLKISGNINNQFHQTNDINNNNENKIINIKMKNIIQIEDKFDNKISQINNNDINYNKGIQIDLNNNSNENINNMNKIYKKSFPKLNEYYNRDNNILEYGINRNISSINGLYFLNQINYNRKLNQLNYINNNDNIPNHNFPNIITNNNNYYYSILDDFPIHMPIYIDNEHNRRNMSPYQRLYNINTFPNYNNFDNNIAGNNYFNKKDLINYNSNLNLLNSTPMREINIYNPNMNNFYNNNPMILRNNYLKDNNSDYDYLNNKNRVINYKYLSQNIINMRKPIYIPLSYKKRSHSHEKPFNLINKYYDENFILEEENEEETNAENNKQHQKQEKEKNKKNIYLSNNQIKYNINNNDFNLLKEKKYISDPNLNNLNNLTENKNINYMLEENRLLNDIKISSNVNLINNYENNSDNIFLEQNYNKINISNNKHISPNLIYEKKSINKKFIINKSPENKEKIKIEKIIINNKDKNNNKIKINEKDNKDIKDIKDKMDKKDKKDNDNKKENNNKVNEVIKEFKINNNASKNNREMNLKKGKLQKDINKKNEIKGNDKKINQKNIVEKKGKVCFDKYIFVNSSPAKKTVNKKPNKTSKSNKNEGTLNFKEKVLNSKKNLFHKNINSKKQNLNKDLKTNSNIKKEKEKIHTENNLLNKKNKKFFNQIRIININNNNQNKLLLIRNAKSEKNINISTDKSLDNIYPKKNNHISYYRKIFNSLNKNNNKYNRKTNKTTYSSNKKQNLSWIPKELNLSGDKKSNKSKKFKRVIKYTATRNINDKIFKNGKRIIIKKNLNNIANSSDNILKNKNINKIKFNVVKKKINFDKVRKIDEGSYAKKYIKKAISIEKKALNNNTKSMTEKPSLKSSIARESVIINLKNNNNNFPSLKHSLKNKEINNTSFNKINKIKESLTFKTLNNINNKTKNKIKKNLISPMSRNNKNIIKKISNTAFKIKIKKGNIRTSLLSEEYNKIKEFRGIKKNNTDFINNTNFL